MVGIDSVHELADAVAGDIGFIAESALDARAAALIALPIDALSTRIFPKLAAAKLQVEGSRGDPDRRPNRRS